MIDVVLGRKRLLLLLLFEINNNNTFLIIKRLMIDCLVFEYKIHAN